MQTSDVCIIGCGSSGMPMVKALSETDLSFDCYEAGSDIGGNWAINNSNGMSAAYESLHINTTTKLMQYADYEMPSDYPDYPNHRQIKAYFDDYMTRFDLRKYVTFKTRVEQCSKDDDGYWLVTLDSGESKRYRELIVANGHHWDPRWPDPAYPGEFDGVIMHSHSYLDPYDPVNMQDKRVVVVGMGNSAMDIACEVSSSVIAKRVYLSIRESAWVLPKYLFGHPIAGKQNWSIPWKIQSWVLRAVLKVANGSPQKHGLPKPKHPLLTTHPTISQHLYGRLDAGDIAVRPCISELKGDSICFDDGTEVKADVLIYCTGYKVSFPFFDQQLIEAPGNVLPLWQRMVKPDVNNLFFLGLLQPIGAIMPIAERQAKFIADIIAGKAKLPSTEAMQLQIQADQAKLSARYKYSKRHTMQVDGIDYLRALDKIHGELQQ